MYYVLVAGFGDFTLPADPFDSASGLGAGAEGHYRLRVTVGAGDADYYAVDLRPGDVLGGSIAGKAGNIEVHRVDGAGMVDSRIDVSATYPASTPLPGGGRAAFAYVAEEAGRYAVSTRDGDGGYRMLLEVHRPGSESGRRPVTQTVFLDFDGERLNTGPFGGWGVRRLAPLRSFLDRWGLDDEDLDAVIDQAVRTVKENVSRDLRERGLNDAFAIRILDSRHDADVFGAPHVSRVVVGGTIKQSGVPAISVSQSTDPGNYSHEETALVLLDVVSDPDPQAPDSFNAYLNDPAADRVQFVGTALGTLISHEIGHLLGSRHTEPFDDTPDVMDRGGNPAVLYGVGPDGVGGTADDVDVDFGVDQFDVFEGMAGLQNTLNNGAWSSRR